MLHHEKQISDKKNEIEKLEEQDEKMKKEKELEKLCLEYEKDMTNNMVDIVFTQYLYII